ncbi:hypothetical protein SCLCIDRAFT_26414 [Scleroderma citrinum Foug A]|uniref:Uncharacterized protein n=1 Tax=Scleroderma citrinum Foug A TaxID=1036808 RepID=A0A0C3DXV8_9AGAM|nr:hypothetical protein SCLCIDRAFT_26414 [Scleroderma citrinum Foug A]
MPNPIIADKLETSHVSSPMDGIEPIPSPWSSTHSCYVHTESDGNNLFCQYHDKFPTYNPENMNSMDQLCDGPTFQHTENDTTQCPLPHPLADSLKELYFTPFLNAMVWHLLSISGKFAM